MVQKEEQRGCTQGYKSNRNYHTSAWTPTYMKDRYWGGVGWGGVGWGGRGEARRGEARRGEARRGEARRGEARRGEARRGEAINLFIYLFIYLTLVFYSSRNIRNRTKKV